MKYKTEKYLFILGITNLLQPYFKAHLIHSLKAIAKSIFSKQYPWKTILSLDTLTPTGKL